MSASAYVVICLHPDSAVDPITFSNYLIDLQIQINDAATGALLGQTPNNAAPVIFWSIPLPGSSDHWAAFIQFTSKDVSINSFGGFPTFAFNRTVARDNATGPSNLPLQDPWYGSRLGNGIALDDDPVRLLGRAVSRPLRRLSPRRPSFER
jgi:hypothetical protein